MNPADIVFDHTIPDVPKQILSDHCDDRCREELADLWEQVIAEVFDVAYRGRSHHNVGTYDQGCRGPLCRKALREHPRRKNPMDISIVSPRYERMFDPILEYFHTVLKYRVREHKSALLARTG